ncbi:MAG: hypothetical protein R2822_10350 [Spirosomataceae bacterium]
MGEKRYTYQRRWVKYSCSRELDSLLVAQSKVYIDNDEAAQNEAGDILIPIEEGLIAPNHIIGNIRGLLTNTCQGRLNEEEITIFKSVGIAMEDVASAFYIYKKGVRGS